MLILAGGVGSRFWPVSTPAHPKQLLPLGSEQPLIRDTVERLDGLVTFERVRVLTGAHLVEPIRTATGLPPESFLVEPAAKGTCPVLAWAAWKISQESPDAVLASIHADHVIEPDSAFRTLLAESAAVAAEQKLLLTTSVPPTRPETGYGYVELGEELAERGSARAARVKRFVEKPDLETATDYVRRGFLWNSGIFVWAARTFLEEVAVCAPEVSECLTLLEQGDDVGFFEQVPNCTVDEAVLERSENVATVRATFAWDDVGSWEAISRTRAADAEGNVVVGDTHLMDAARNIVYSERGHVVLFGVEDLVVVRTDGVTFVTSRERSADMKTLLQTVPQALGGRAE